MHLKNNPARFSALGLISPCKYNIAHTGKTMHDALNTAEVLSYK